ncbi:hypothetical protein [Fuerstiella marisgermanici]|nr:hypothetical protein [Fuerstiella marisgermanici]
MSQNPGGIIVILWNRPIGTWKRAPQAVTFTLGIHFISRDEALPQEKE